MDEKEFKENEPGPSNNTLQNDEAVLSTDSKIKSNYTPISDLQANNSKKSDFSSAFTKIKDSDLYEEVSISSTATITDRKIPNKFPSKNSIIVNSRQRGNPILKFIRNVPWEYGEIIPDYVMGNITCAMFLSLRYHTLNPNYIHERLKLLGRQYELRVLLVQIDVKEPHLELKQLTKICVLADLTLMLAWNPEEAGRIIETYKVFENKPPDLIMEKQDTNPYSQIVDALTSIKSINRSDAMTLLSTFGSLEKIIGAREEELALCPGFGPQKATKLYSILNQTFKKI